MIEPRNNVPISVVGLDEKRSVILAGVKAHCERLLNHTPRFKYFTLHGSAHLNSLFEILAFLRKGGIELNTEELFLLSLSICVHDLGMVISLENLDRRDILDGRPTFPDVAVLENYIRETHHELVDIFFERDLGFLVDLGLSPAQIAQIRSIAKCHRKIVLQQQSGMIKYLGALMRIIDELDIGSERAPTDVLMNLYEEMDATSCWHWYKHIIVEGWSEGHTLIYSQKPHSKHILFKIIVHPTRQGSIPYWLKQIHRPLIKALEDDGAYQIISDKFGVEIEINISTEDSSVNNLSSLACIEEKALSANQKVILLIDDESRKLEDLFLPLMEDFHVIFSGNAKDALSKLDAGSVDLAIVDMQIGSGFLWTDKETQDFKFTGIKICRVIMEKYPKTKLAILTGTRHRTPDLTGIPLEFFLRKPVDPTELNSRIRNVLS